MTGGAADQGRLDLDDGMTADVDPAEEESPVDATKEVDDAVSPDPPDRVVRVLPDVAAVGRAFDYLVPPAWGDDGRA